MPNKISGFTFSWRIGAAARIEQNFKRVTDGFLKQAFGADLGPPPMLGLVAGGSPGHDADLRIRPKYLLINQLAAPGVRSQRKHVKRQRLNPSVTKRLPGGHRGFKSALAFDSLRWSYNHPVPGNAKPHQRLLCHLGVIPWILTILFFPQSARCNDVLVVPLLKLTRCGEDSIIPVKSEPSFHDQNLRR